MSDIYELLEGKRISDPVVLEKFGPEMGKVLTARLLSKQQERVPTLRMSNLGRKDRQLWYELNGYKQEEISGKTHLKFLYGDIIESLVLVLAEASGHKVERLQEEIEVDGIQGHIDAVIDGVLVDVKSASPFGYKKFEDGTILENDPFGYIGQLSGYAHSLKLEARYIAVNKVLGDICTFTLPKEVIDNYDVRGRITKIRKVVGSSTPPERCYEPEPDGKSGNEKLGTGCSYCGFKMECHKDANSGNGLYVYAYSDGPRYLTKVVREPQVFKLKG